ncbi:Disintegrin and metalloproteinase domain-containing protein 15 [Halotydeus destructor]|nr:Disintegrin and metalloproteinase domain-containing protein 15 [Halotydeus destructor]
MANLLKLALLINSITALLAKDFYIDNYPHATIKPEIVEGDPGGQKLKLKFDVNGATHDYDLVRDDDFLSTELVDKLVKEHGSLAKVNCRYRNTDQSAIVSLSICDGQVNGVIGDSEIHYDDELKTHNYYHDMKVEASNCSLIVSPTEGAAFNFSQETGGRVSDDTVVEIVIVSDFEMFKKYFELKSDVLTNFQLDVAHHLARIYDPVGIKVILVDTIIWEYSELVGKQVHGHYPDGTAKLAVESHMKKFAEVAAREYYGKKNIKYDLMHLITGYVYSTFQRQNPVGMANYAKVCEPSGVTVSHYLNSKYRRHHVREMAKIIAHEMAHSLAAQHVDEYDPKCPCSGPGGKCIMNDVYDSDSETWADCTKRHFGSVSRSKNARWACLHQRAFPGITNPTGTVLPWTEPITSPKTEAPSTEKKGTSSSFGLIIVLNLVALLLLVAAIFFGCMWYKGRQRQNATPARPVEEAHELSAFHRLMAELREERANRPPEAQPTGSISSVSTTQPTPQNSAGNPSPPATPSPTPPSRSEPADPPSVEPSPPGTPPPPLPSSSPPHSDAEAMPSGQTTPVNSGRGTPSPSQPTPPSTPRSTSSDDMSNKDGAGS